MKLLSVLFLFIFSYTVSAQTPDYRLMVFGDSLSSGYRLSQEDAFYSQLQKALHQQGYKNIKVIHNSLSGETSAGGVKRVQKAVDMNPDAVILELGINDALRGQDLTQTKQNLQTIISKFHEKSIPVMLIGMQAPPTQGTVYRQQFTKMYQDLAHQNNLILYPFFMKDVIKLRPGSLNLDTRYVQGDNVHPTADGVGIMVNNVLPDVLTFLKQNGVKK